MRIVDKAEFDAVFKDWELCEGNTATYAKIIPRNERRASITFTDLELIVALFGTRNVNLYSTYQGPLSDVTPGDGLDVCIEVRTAAYRRI